MSSEHSAYYTRTHYTHIRTQYTNMNSCFRNRICISYSGKKNEKTTTANNRYTASSMLPDVHAPFKNINGTIILLLFCIKNLPEKKSRDRSRARERERARGERERERGREKTALQKLMFHDDEATARNKNSKSFYHFTNQGIMVCRPFVRRTL